MDIDKIGNTIRTIRREKNLKLDAVAKKAGMSATGYGNIERGETLDLSLNRLLLIAKALNVSIIKILSIDDSFIPIEKHEQIIRKYIECIAEKDKEIRLLRLQSKKHNLFQHSTMNK